MPISKKPFRLLAFPFLIESPVKYLEELGYLPPNTQLAEAVSLLGATPRAQEILEGVVLDKDVNLFDASEIHIAKEAIAFYASALIASSFQDNWLINKFANYVSKNFSKLLADFDDEMLAELAKKQLRLDISYFPDKPLVIQIAKTSHETITNSYPFAIKLYTYLKLAKRLSSDEKWMLSNQLVSNGMVYIKRSDLERIIEEAVYIKMLESLKDYADKTKSLKELPQPLQEIKEKTKLLLAKHRPVSRFRSFGGQENLGIIIEAFPPCIANIYQKALSGANMSHAERFQLATFMLHIGAAVEDVLEIMKHAPDYNEKIATYQVEHLAGKRGGGKKYLPFNCEKSKVTGLCVSDCGTKTPLQKYYLNLKARGGTIGKKEKSSTS